MTHFTDCSILLYSTRILEKDESAFPGDKQCAVLEPKNIMSIKALCSYLLSPKVWEGILFLLCFAVFVVEIVNSSSRRFFWQLCSRTARLHSHQRRSCRTSSHIHALLSYPYWGELCCASWPWPLFLHNRARHEPASSTPGPHVPDARRGGTLCLQHGSRQYELDPFARPLRKRPAPFR